MVKRKKIVINEEVMRISVTTATSEKLDLLIKCRIDGMPVDESIEHCEFSSHELGLQAVRVIDALIYEYRTMYEEAKERIEQEGVEV